jgi:hypothetical protein
MDIRESVGSRNSYSRINDCKKLSNVRFPKKSRGLKTPKNPKKDDQRFRPSQQERARCGRVVTAHMEGSLKAVDSPVGPRSKAAHRGVHKARTKVGVAAEMRCLVGDSERNVPTTKS